MCNSNLNDPDSRLRRIRYDVYSEFEEYMKAVEFGQEFISFSFVIEDGKCVVNIFEVCWRLLPL